MPKAQRMVIAKHLGLVTAWLLAHGGVAGAIIEVSAVLAIVALAVAVWLREKKTQERK